MTARSITRMTESAAGLSPTTGAEIFSSGPAMQKAYHDPKRSLATDVEMTAFWSQTAVGSEPVNLTNDGVSASALDEPVR